MPTRAHSAAAGERRDGVGDELPDSQRKRQPPPVEAQIAALARAQHGVVGLRQLLALGLSRSCGRLSAPERAAASGDARRARRRARPAHDQGALHGGGPLVRCRVAAQPPLGRVPQGPAGRKLRPCRCELPRQRRARAGVRVHRTRTLAPRDVTVHDGIPITSVARTLLDLADVAPRRLVERAIHQAEILRVFDLRAVDDVLARANGRRGGRRAARRARAGAGVHAQRARGGAARAGPRAPTCRARG